MTKAKPWLGEIGLPLLLVALLAAIVLAQANPLLTLPNPDGGYNLFAGSQILKGRLPYVDFWNTKGPAIYYLNALGLYLGHGLRWGVWIIEYLFLAAAIFLLFQLMRRQWGTGAAAFGVIVSMIGLNAVLNGGNLTEEYALPFNVAALYLFWSEDRKTISQGDGNQGRLPSASIWRYLLIGCLAGVSFSFRANNIGIPAAIGFAVILSESLHRRTRRALPRIALIAAGFAIPVLIGVLYFWYKGALSDYIGAVYLYNVRYAGSRAHPLSVLVSGFTPSKVGWPAWIALGGAALAVVTIIRQLTRGTAPTAFEILLGSVLWVEVVLSSISWRMFGHYFISWMPAIALLSGEAFDGAIRLVRSSGFTRFLEGDRPAALLGILVLGVSLISYPELGQYATTFSQLLFDRQNGIEYRDYLSNYVSRHTDSGDLVLTWPGDAWINFASRREPPVRLVFYPVFDAGTITEEQGKGYVDELAAHKPAVIIDCADLQNEVPSLDPATRAIQHAARDFLYAPPHIQEVFDFVAMNYHIEMKSRKCTIYRVNP